MLIVHKFYLPLNTKIQFSQILYHFINKYSFFSGFQHVTHFHLRPQQNNFNIRISTKILFKSTQTHSNMHLKAFPASTQYLVPKLLHIFRYLLQQYPTSQYQTLYQDIQNKTKTEARGRNVNVQRQRMIQFKNSLRQSSSRLETQGKIDAVV